MDKEYLAGCLERGERAFAPKLAEGRCRWHAMSEDELAVVIELLRNKKPQDSRCTDTNSEGKP